MSLADIPDYLRDLVESRDEGRCQYCQLHQNGQGSRFHIDHIWPKSKGGPTTLDNLALQCPNCSLHKSGKIQSLDPLTEAVAPLYHPLQQAWTDHFEIRSDGRCVGLTAAGRATVEALQMNSLRMLLARQHQVERGLIVASS